MYHIFFIHSSINGHLAIVKSAAMNLAIVYSAAVNIGVHVSFQIRVFIFLVICPGVGLLDHMVTLSLVF